MKLINISDEIKNYNHVTNVYDFLIFLLVEYLDRNQRCKL